MKTSDQLYSSTEFPLDDLPMLLKPNHDRVSARATPKWNSPLLPITAEATAAATTGTLPLLYCCSSGGGGGERSERHLTDECGPEQWRPPKINGIVPTSGSAGAHRRRHAVVERAEISPGPELPLRRF